MSLPTQNLGPPPDPKDPRFLQWLALLWAYVKAGASGITGVSQGGTGLSSGTSGGILGFTATTTLASSALLTNNAIVLGGGAGATPKVLGSLGTTTTLLHGNAAGAPTFAAVSLTADVSGTLPIANGGSGLTALGTANQLLGVNNAANALEYKSVTATTAGALSVPTTLTVTGNSSLNGTDNVIDGLKIGSFGTTPPTVPAIGIGTTLFTALSSGTRSIGIGRNVLVQVTTGSDNTAIGDSAAQFMIGGSNTAIGSGAMSGVTGVSTGTQNTAFGISALLGVTTGGSNTAIGQEALSVLTSGSNNVCIGSQAGKQITTGSLNLVIGSSAIGLSGTVTGDGNVAIGPAAMRASTGAVAGNVAIGRFAGINTTGSNGVFIGVSAGDSSNTVSGSGNVGIGPVTYGALSSGANNVSIGNTGAATLTTGSDNTLIGKSADVSTGAASFRTAIGSGAVVSTDNQIVLGRSAGQESVLIPGAATVTGKINSADTTDSTSGATGSIQTSGGIGAAKAIVAGTTVRTGGYTVATLPAGTQGMMAYVTNALAPTFLAVLVGGGTVVTPCFYDGTNWVGS